MSNWTIAVGEEPLSALGPVDETLLEGREFTHSFLALMDDEGNIVEEIHGRAANGFGRIFNNPTNTVRQYFNLAGAKPGTVVSTEHGEKLKVFLDNPDQEKMMSKGRVYVAVVSGDQSDIAAMWHKAIEKALNINELDADYLAVGIKGRPGQNCHRVTASILTHIGQSTTVIAECMHDNYMRPSFSGCLPIMGGTIKICETLNEAKNKLLSSTRQFVKDKKQTSSIQIQTLQREKT